MFVLERFEQDTKYIFDKNLYYKICKKLKIQPEDWAEICHLKDVQIISEDSGFIYLNDNVYNVSCLWCREKELLINIYTSSDIIEGDEF
ncbi:hypothetical protein [Romboutsia timonensis]|uniref:hypothetical protein n=1 Tax=Romboutsia timonensis TaxID=1776391 RepID=UPI0023F7BED7|nr:hypothetical protein [Romboutsia timonensis]